jgi:sigma-B regulation protein RsbU (phosphoserine phosphatase)
MCTDGINETSNTSGEQFGDKRLLKVIQANRDRSAREIIDALYQAVRDFAGDEPQHDDITVVITKVLP